MHFGTSCGDLELILEALGDVLEASWGHLGQLLELTSEHLGSQLGYKHFVTNFFGSCVCLRYLSLGWHLREAESRLDLGWLAYLSLGT